MLLNDSNHLLLLHYIHINSPATLIHPISSTTFIYKRHCSEVATAATAIVQYLCFCCCNIDFVIKFHYPMQIALYNTQSIQMLLMYSPRCMSLLCGIEFVKFNIKFCINARAVFYISNIHKKWQTIAISNKKKKHFVQVKLCIVLFLLKSIYVELFSRQQVYRICMQVYYRCL